MGEASKLGKVWETHTGFPLSVVDSGNSPIAKSTLHQKELKARGAELNAWGAFNEFEAENKTEEKPYLLHRQSIVSKTEGFSAKTESEVEFEPRSEVDYTRSSLGFDGWELPGHGDPYPDCGAIRFRGCLNVADHHPLDKTLDDSDRTGLAFVQAYRRSCMRASCPKCYEAWAAREAGRLEHRLTYYRGRWGRPVHVSVNPEPSLWILPFSKLRSLAIRIVKQAGIVGGSMIYHPFRQDDNKKWFFSPHFHVIGYGWHRGFFIPGWVVRNHGVRKSVFFTAMYQLSHAGVSERHHTIVWFGELSYNKLIVPFEVEEKHTCPLCGADLVPLLYCGGERVPPPDTEGDYFQDVGLWRERPMRWNCY